MSDGKLLDSVVLSDSAITETKLKMESKASKQYLSFISMDMICQSAVATGVAAAVYLGQPVLGFPLTAAVARFVHLITGMLLGILLTARVIMGVYLTFTATSHVYGFTKACRSLAALSSSVSETLTVSAGAEIEKKAVAKFRYELVRLLNLSFHCYALMLQGLRLAVPPASLTGAQGEALASAPNPTVLVAKMVASLFEQQRAAKRISSEQTALMMGKVGELVEAYHASLAMLLSPAPVSLTAFTYFFTAVWTYVSAAAIAEMQLAASGLYPTFGFGLTLVYSGFLSLFVFGLYEAGNVVEAPLKSVMALIVTEDMSTALADDLTSLVED